MLHLLKDYAQENDLAVVPGFAVKQVRALLMFSADGRYLKAMPLDEDNQRVGGCPHLSQPEIMAAGKGARHFLVDSAAVVALLGEEGVDEKLREKHAYFVDLLRKAASVVPELASIAAAIDDESTLARIREDFGKSMKPTDNVTFVVSNRRLVDETRWHAWWQAFRASLGDEKKGKKGKKGKATESEASRMRCLMTGELVPPLATHPKIVGLIDVGGLATGDSLASFKQDAFRSFGLDQSANAAMSEEAASVYQNALNDLIAQRSRRFGGLKVLFWYDRRMEKDLTGEIDQPTFVYDVPAPTSTPRRRSRAEVANAYAVAAAHLDSIKTGIKGEDRSDFLYHSLSLSGAGGRVMVRDYSQGTFGDLKRGIAQWFADLAIVSSDGDTPMKPPKFLALIGATVRDLKKAPPNLIASYAAALWRTAISRDQPFPPHLATAAFHLARSTIVNGEEPKQAAWALIRAYLVRKDALERKRDDNPTTDSEERQPTVKLELDEDQPDAAYHCGRLMAVLAEIQREALPNVNASVVQRYFAAACATPALVLGRLVRTAQFHLDKITYRKRADELNAMLAAVMSCIPSDAPVSLKTLSLERQMLFSLGYYQQRAHIESLRAAAKQEKSTPSTKPEEASNNE